MVYRRHQKKYKYHGYDTIKCVSKLINSLKMENESLVKKIDSLLPQTQCTLCTYPRCRDYAEAIANDDVEINQCPPGGDVTISALASLLNKSVVGLNETHGIHESKGIAYIEEPQCIGCKLCIKACPVDCIVGTAKLMHTVIADHCTGCKLCIPVCPTDCIKLIDPDIQKIDREHPSPWPEFTHEQVERARVQNRQTIERNNLREQKRKNRRRTIERKQMKKEILEAIKRKNLAKPFSVKH